MRRETRGRPEQSRAARRARRVERLWTTYRVTEQMYEVLYVHQRGLCGLCLKPGDDLDGQQPLVVDEDWFHNTGRVRGLLHGRCNRLLTERVEAYLEDPPAYEVLEHYVPAAQRAAMVRKRELDRARRRKKRRELEEEAMERTTYRYGTGQARTLAERLAAASRAAS